MNLNVKNGKITVLKNWVSEQYLDIPESEKEKLVKTIQENKLPYFELEAARNKLVRSYLPFIFKKTLMYDEKNPLSDPQDLFQCMIVGLLSAVEKYDPSKTANSKFINFAWFFIQTEIQRYFTKDSRVISAPWGTGLRMENKSDEIKELQSQYSQFPAHLEDPARNAEGESTVLGDTIATSSYTIEEADRMLDASYIRSELIRVLNKNEFQVLYHSFGLDGGTNLSPKVVAEITELTEDKVRKLRSIAITKLKHSKVLKKLYAEVV